jgi:hypothetical protein
LGIAWPFALELLDQLIGATAQRERHSNAERLRSFQIDDQFDFRRLLDRQIARFLALENPASIDARSGC